MGRRKNDSVLVLLRACLVLRQRLPRLGFGATNTELLLGWFFKCGVLVHFPGTLVAPDLSTISSAAPKMCCGNLW